MFASYPVPLRVMDVEEDHARQGPRVLEQPTRPTHPVYGAPSFRLESMDPTPAPQTLSSQASNSSNISFRAPSVPPALASPLYQSYHATEPDSDPPKSTKHLHNTG